MKKLLLGIVLLTLLVAISYLRTTRESERSEKAFRDGQEAGGQTVQLKQQDLDSLAGLIEEERSALAQHRAATADSLAQRDEIFARAVDSLSAQVDSQRSEITRLREQAAAGNSQNLTNRAGDSSAPGKASHERILNHYRLAVSKLPADLSAYEHRVALTEIRIETAREFAITVDRLDQIRKAHNVEY